MTDRELLELAAKAAGIEVGERPPIGVRWWVGLRYFDSQGVVREVVDFDRDGPIEKRWNPLTDDGDALRLAVKLNIDVRFDSEPDGPVVRAVAAFDDDGEEVLAACCTEDLGKPDTPGAATRRAIVRAAAAIGASK